MGLLRQGVVLGPFYVDICIFDLLYITELTEVSNFATDTTFHACNPSLVILENLVNRLENDANFKPKVTGTLRKICKISKWL